MNRFLVKKISPKDKFVALKDPEQLHHLRDVLRIKPLERVELFDGSGNEYFAVVKETGIDRVRFEIKDRRPADEEGVGITVACAIPKNVKMDDIIDKLTQLGVERIIPLQTERVIVKLDRQKRQERLSRWQRVALSAAKQSRRSRIPIIEPVTGFKDALLASGGFDIRLIPTLEGRRQSLRDIVGGSCAKIRKIMLIIGPEGDFTPGEVALAKNEGFLPVSLGPCVLRVDTAAVAAVSFIRLNEGR